MKRILVALMIISPLSYADLEFKDLGSGWRAMTQQLDPFDTSKVQIIQVRKGIFVLTCINLNWQAENDMYFDGYSFVADIKYIIDDNSPVGKGGRYSTYIGGSDMITDKRYFSFKINEADSTALKKGRTLKVAGNYSSSGWQTKTLELEGFESVYNQMCD